MIGTSSATSQAFGNLQVVNAGAIFKIGLLPILAGLTGLRADSTTWLLDPDPYTSDADAALVRCKVRRIAPLGIDEHRYRADNTGTDETGNRDIVLTLRAECYDLSVEAGELLGRILTGLMFAATGDALEAIGLAYQKNSGITDLSHQVDNRVVNAASVDVWLNGVSNVSTPDAGQIASVDTTNQVPGTITH